MAVSGAELKIVRRTVSWLSDRLVDI